MAPIVTVDYILRLLQRLHDNGKGEMKVKCKDNFLHEDEIFIDYMGNEIEFRGYIFNLQIAQRVKEFCNDIDVAEKKFYGFISEVESEEK